MNLLNKEKAPCIQEEKHALQEALSAVTHSQILDIVAKAQARNAGLGQSLSPAADQALGVFPPHSPLRANLRFSLSKIF